MGAEQFWTVAFGKTADNAFKVAIKQAQYEHGHAGYTGSVAEKTSYILIPVPKGKDPKNYADELLENEDRRIDDKWGPAGCIDITKEVKKDYKAKKKRWPRGKSAFLFFGWASS